MNSLTKHSALLKNLNCNINNPSNIPHSTRYSRYCEVCIISCDCARLSWSSVNTGVWSLCPRRGRNLTEPAASPRPSRSRHRASLTHWLQVGTYPSSYLLSYFIVLTYIYHRHHWNIHVFPISWIIKIVSGACSKLEGKFDNFCREVLGNHMYVQILIIIK